MNINPKVEPWLRALLEGVENSNHSAEVVATGAYASGKLVKALEGMVSEFACTDAVCPHGCLEARAALALAGETP